MTCPNEGAGAAVGNTLSQCGEALSHWAFPGLDKPCSTTHSFQRQLCCSLCSSDSLLGCTRAQEQHSKTFAFWDGNIAAETSICLSSLGKTTALFPSCVLANGGRNPTSNKWLCFGWGLDHFHSWEKKLFLNSAYLEESSFYLNDLGGIYWLLTEHALRLFPGV